MKHLLNYLKNILPNIRNIDHVKNSFCISYPKPRSKVFFSITWKILGKTIHNAQCALIKNASISEMI